jgi:deoxyribose-phosphate aldolase
MNIVIGSDHGGFELKQRLVAHLQGRGHTVQDVGTHSTDAVDYPVFARKVAEAVAGGRAERGIMIDGAGIGSSMTANKVPGVRAAMAYDVSSARNGREHNDANVLTLGAGLIGPNLAVQIVDVFLETACSEARHQRRVAMIDQPGGGPVTVGSMPMGDLSEADLARVAQRLQALMGGGAAPAAASRGPFASGPVRRHGGPPMPGRVPEELNRFFDHTILKPDATAADVDKIVAEAREHDFMSVCVNPCWVRRVADGLRGTRVITCSVVGFPLGTNTPDMKAMETRKAIRDGAREIDMVVNVGRLKAGDDEYVFKDILAVTDACRDGSAVSKVIIETALLTDAEKVRACELSRRARADFVKTSTGFASGGATAEDVALMASVVHDAGMEVKASGGIRTYDDARRMIAAGATRLGASASVNIMREALQTAGA